MATVAAIPMTTEELLALPHDGRRRWLIHGELHEACGPGENGMTVRNRFHSITMANLSGELYLWRSTLTPPRGNVVCGDAGVRLPGEPETTIGVDVAYADAAVMVRQTASTMLIEGVPTLVVEILSPSARVEEIDKKLAAYASADVPLVWVVDPHDCTVTIYERGEEPTLVNRKQLLLGGAALPGFCVPVARFFE